MRPRDVILLALPHRTGECVIVEEDVVLVVELEAATAIFSFGLRECAINERMPVRLDTA